MKNLKDALSKIDPEKLPEIIDSYMLTVPERHSVVTTFLYDSNLSGVSLKYGLLEEESESISEAIANLMGNVTAALFTRHLIEHTDWFEKNGETPKQDSTITEPLIAAEDFCISGEKYDNIVDMFIHNTGLDILLKQCRICKEEYNTFVNNLTGVIAETANEIFTNINKRNPGALLALSQEKTVKNVFNFQLTDDQINDIVDEVLTRDSFKDIGARYGLDIETISALKKDIQYAILRGNRITVERFTSIDEFQSQLFSHDE